MITRLRLRNFKNFRDAELKLGPFTILVGTNASGKSNLRDAFRFLHGIGRGYSLAEIIGAKYGEGGELQWSGIRGGVSEIANRGKQSFRLNIGIHDNSTLVKRYEYAIEAQAKDTRNGPSVNSESLYYDGEMTFAYQPDGFEYNKEDLIVPTEADEIERASRSLSRFSPIMPQIMDAAIWQQSGHIRLDALIASLNLLSMRFYDFHPDAMRQPSFPGQATLGDRGENLSSVLQAIYQGEHGKETLLSWLQELTPMDAVDFEFTPDQIGRVLVTLIEKNGQRTSAYSASDGTLRFLGMLAALLGEKAPRLHFFDELESGIHPTRLHLLVQLIEQQVREGKTQVVATTHSPTLLRMLSPESLEHVSVLYRAPDDPAARIVRLMDLPDAERLVREQDVAALFESGWLEDAIALSEPEEAA